LVLPLDDLEPIDVRHNQIQQDSIRSALFEQAQGAAASVGLKDAIALRRGAQHPREEPQRLRLVVHQQHGLHRLAQILQCLKQRISCHRLEQVLGHSQTARGHVKPRDPTGDRRRAIRKVVQITYQPLPVPNLVG